MTVSEDLSKTTKLLANFQFSGSKNIPHKLKNYWVTDSSLSVPEGSAIFEEQLLGYSPSAFVSKPYFTKTEKIGVLLLPETLSLNQPVTQQSLKRSLEQVKEVGKNTSNSEEKFGPKRRISSEVEPQHSLTPEREGMPFITDLNVDVDYGLQQQMEAERGHMNKSVEAIHEADAFKDTENMVHLLIHQTSSLQSRTSLEDFLCCLEEFKETIPDTMIYMMAAQSYRTSLQLELARIGASLLEAQEQYSSLDAEVPMSLSEEESKLEAEIQRLMAKKEQLLSRRNCNPPC